MRAFFSELEGGWGPQLSTQQEGPPADQWESGPDNKVLPLPAAVLSLFTDPLFIRG